MQPFSTSNTQLLYLKPRGVDLTSVAFLTPSLRSAAYQFFSRDCAGQFGMVGDRPPARSSDATCSSAFSIPQFSPVVSDAVPVTFIPLAADRPPTVSEGRDFPSNEELQQFTRAR